MPVDVADRASVTSAIAAVSEAFGRIDICVNAAGIPNPGKVFGKSGPLDMEQFQRVIDVNLVGAFDLDPRFEQIDHEVRPHVVGVEAVEPGCDVPLPALAPDPFARRRVGEEHIHVEVAVLVRRAPGDAPRDRHSDDAQLTAEELDDAVEDALVLRR